MNITTFISTIYTQRRLTVLAVLIAILALLATAPLYINLGDITIMTDLIMYGVLTVSWVMFSAPTRYMSLASAAFFGTGIYTSALLFARDGALLPLPAVIVMGGLVSFCFSLIIGSATLRLRGIYFAIFTFGLVELARRLLQYYEFHATGTRGRYITLIDIEPSYYTILIIFVAAIVTIYLIRRSRYGLALEGIGEHEEAAAHMGINTTMVKIITFAISAFFMGAVGAAAGMRMVYTDPTIAFNANYTFTPVLMALVGGMGQLYGPVLGAFGFAYLQYSLLTKSPDYYMLIFGITLVLVIVFLPAGLVGLIQKLLNRLERVIPKSWKGDKAEQHANT